MQLIFTDEALNDLEYIHDFLIKAGVVEVDEIKDRLISSAKRLLDFPKLGITVHSSARWGDVRDLFSEHYCLRYTFYQGDVYILRIWHQKENERNG